MYLYLGKRGRYWDVSNVCVGLERSAALEPEVILVFIVVLIVNRGKRLGCGCGWARVRTGAVPLQVESRGGDRRSVAQNSDVNDNVVCPRPHHCPRPAEREVILVWWRRYRGIGEQPKRIGQLLLRVRVLPGTGSEGSLSSREREAT